ncbi:MAG TPA: MBL fold metallo-hydrolase [Steroidobacteraceae bacterium]|jgi:cyclase|nr:MBL fold metallo-hydrolase [Steroidobacteraceae bacterium]
MSTWRYRKGLHDLGNGGYAYLQPDGTWGWSNAGLIESRGETLLVDTLMGLAITRDMLSEMRGKVPAAASIRRLVNTHANADHVLGNELVTGAEIIGTRATAEDVARMNPDAIAAMAKNWRQMGEGAEFFFETMGRTFDFSGVTVTPPTTLFERELELRVGDKIVRLIDLGPAHTRSDLIVYVPADKLVFTGDLLFNQGHPIMWEGPVQNWIGACHYIEALDLDTVVPGHGPICDKAAVREMRHYFEYLRDQARARYDAGLSYEEAARDIAMDAFGTWTDPERVVGNVFVLYREFGAKLEAPGPLQVFDLLARHSKWLRERRAS